MSREPLMSNTRLFFNSLPTQRTSPFSFPVRDARLLKHLTRDASIWIVGGSTRVREGLSDLLRLLEGGARGVKDIGLNLDAEPDQLRKTLRRITASPRAMLLLAEEAYGPAFAALCTLAPPLTPVVLPSGFLVPTLPAAGFTPTHPESASLEAIDQGLVALAGKRLIVWAGPEQFRHAIKPLCDHYCPTAVIAGLVSADPALWGREQYGYTVHPPEFLRATPHDAILASLAGAGTTHTAMHQAVRGLTPVLFVQPKDLLSHVTFASEAVRALPDFSKRIYYNPHLTREKYAILFHDSPEFSPEHYDGVSTTRLPIMLRGNTYVHGEVSTPWMRIRDGLRLTTDGNESADKAIHMFGPSYTLGSLSEDHNTIASHVQRLCNRAIEQGSPRYNVYNHGVGGNRLENIVRQVEKTALAPGELVLVTPHHSQYAECLEPLRHLHGRCRERGAHCAVFFQPSLLNIDQPSDYEQSLIEEYKSLHGLLFTIPESVRRALDVSNICRRLVALGVPAFDLQPSVQRPHAWGEIFVDFIHTAHTGNACIAQVMSDMFIRHTEQKTEGDAAQQATLEFLEHVKNRFMTNAAFIDWLDAVPRFPNTGNGAVGAIVMNCNPFTLGHQYIIQKALEDVEALYIFAVEEDASDFAFQDRLTMIRQGVAHLGERVQVVPSGTFILSSFTFPEYFCKDTIEYIPDTSVESALFGTLIAPALGISVRFFGEEPLCQVTRAYHTHLKRILPLCGIGCEEIPRLEHDNAPVSASRVRRLLHEHKLDELSSLIPSTSLNHINQRRNATTI